MFDCITIGDAMRDIFIFPSSDEMEKPVTESQIQTKEHLPAGKAGFEKYLIFGLGDKITVSDVEYSIGGTAANVAVALSKLGYKVGIVSACGDDNNGIEIKDSLSKAKVDTKNVKIYQSKKSSFSVIVSYKGERTIFVYHAFEPANFHLPNNLNTDWVYIGPMAQGFERTYNQIVAEVVKNNLKVAVNPGAVQIQAGLNSFGGLLKLINVIFLNRQEALSLSGLKGVPSIKDLVKVIHLEGPKIVVITDGKEGAYAYDGTDFYRVGAYPGHRLEATGAGDSFAAAFLSGLISEEPLQMCLKWGVINSASVIEQIGAQSNLLGKNTIKRRAKEYRWPAATLRFS
ncbi:MAG: putative Ribokinase [Candidatus Berkelbacteria bacterium]|nr:putative Ribokinase [Candidatus Berkelbacteria bacterium]